MKVSGVLLDLGGVIFNGEQAVPGALEAVKRLKSLGYSIRFLTNTTREPRRRIVEKLARLGLDVAGDDVLTPVDPARALMRTRVLRPHLLVHPALLEDFDDLRCDDPDTVVVGDAGEAFTYAALNTAFRLLDEGAVFLALARNRAFAETDGALSLDAGPFVAALETACRRDATLLGKPAADFFRAGLASLGSSAAETVMIGDDAGSDVGGAMAAGLAGVLVRTGKYRAGDEATLAQPPSHVADDVDAAVDWIASHGVAAPSA